MVVLTPQFAVECVHDVQPIIRRGSPSRCCSTPFAASSLEINTIKSTINASVARRNPDRATAADYTVGCKSTRLQALSRNPGVILRTVHHGVTGCIFGCMTYVKDVGITAAGDGAGCF